MAEKKRRSQRPAEVASTFKGTGFRGYRNYLEKRLSAEQRRAILDALGPDVRKLLEGDSLLISAMYPIELQHHFLEIFAKHFGRDAESHLRALGQEVAETDLRGIYRVFIWAASVPQTMYVLTRVWNSYFSTGKASWQPLTKHTGCTTIQDAFQHALHLPVVAGYIEVAIRLAGGKNGRVEYGACVDDAVPFNSSWED